MNITITNRHTIDEIINEARLCHLAVVQANGAPYVFPMSFGYDGTHLYIHSSSEHSTLPQLQKDSRVCISISTHPELIYRDKQVGCTYTHNASSVIIHGTVSFLQTSEEKRKALDILMKHYTDAHTEYSEPAIKGVTMWRITPTNITARKFGRRSTL